MAKTENPPFPRGQTFFNGGTTDSTSGAQYEGMVYTFEDQDLSATGAKSNRTNKMVRCMIVRNVAASALLPGYLVTFKTTSAGTYTGQVDGYATTTAQAPAFPVDEWLPSTGVPVNDLFYVVIEGPAVCKTDLAGGANNLLPIGTVLVALTAATSGATTAGRVKPQDMTGATAVLGQEIQGRIGRALSAKTTANTNASILVDITKF